MSKNINVNPGQYKVAGRERQGEDVVQDVEKRRLTVEQPRKRRRPSVSKAAPKRSRP